MDTQYDEYIAFLKSYRDELTEYLANEREKRRALIENDQARLEAMLKVQQAETMKFRVFESKRIKLQSQIGLPDRTARELLTQVGDPETKRCMEALFTEIAELARQIQEQNQQSLELAKVNLKVINLMMRSAEKTNAELYGPNSTRRNPYSTGDAFEETI